MKLRHSLLAVLFVACSPAPEPVMLSGDHEGLKLNAGVTNTGHSIAVEVVLRNERVEPIVVVSDQCGRVVDVELERTEFRPEGQRWEGSVQAVKDLVLADQAFLDRPDSFAPRRVGDSSSAVPTCARPERMTTLQPGDEVAERWELAFDDSIALREVGSDATMVSLEAVEARDPDELEFLDILPADAEDDARAGRVLRAEASLAEILQRPASDPIEGPSYGELFDRLLQDDALRRWIESQPVDAWGRADLRPAYPDYGLDRVQFKLVTKEFEQAALVTAEADGSNVVLELPDEDTRARPFARTAGTLPPGITAFPDSDYVLTEDLQIGEVKLPSGRVIVGEYLFDAEPLAFTVAPGPYPAHATLARYRDYPNDDVAFLTLVLAESPTVRWQPSGAVAVDGGTTVITSVEGRDDLQEVPEDQSPDLGEAIFDSMVAHDYLATEWELTPETNLVQVASGVGDGGYPVYVGYDADGKPTRVVVDFYLLHLSWPDA